MKEVVLFEQITEESMPDVIETLAGDFARLKISNTKDIKNGVLKQLLNSLNEKQPFSLDIVLSKTVLDSLSAKLLKNISSIATFPVILMDEKESGESAELSDSLMVWGIYSNFQDELIRNIQAHNQAHLDRIIDEAKEMHKRSHEEKLPDFELKRKREFDVYEGELVENKELLGGNEANLEFGLKFLTPKAEEEVHKNKYKDFNTNNPPVGCVVKKTNKTELELVLDYDEEEARDIDVFTPKPSTNTAIIYKDKRFQNYVENSPNYHNAHIRFGDRAASLINKGIHNREFKDVVTEYVRKLSQVDILLNDANYLYCLLKIEEYAKEKRECLITFLTITYNHTSHLIDILAAFEVFWAKFERLCDSESIWEGRDKINHLIYDFCGQHSTIVCMERLLTILINAAKSGKLEEQLNVGSLELRCKEYNGAYYASEYEGEIVVSNNTLYTMLCEAAKKGDLAAVRSLYARKIYPIDYDKRTIPIIHAIQSPNVRMKKFCRNSNMLGFLQDRYVLLKLFSIERTFPIEIVNIIMLSYHLEISTICHTRVINVLLHYTPLCEIRQGGRKEVTSYAIESRNFEIIRTMTVSWDMLVQKDDVIELVKPNDLDNLEDIMLWLNSYLVSCNFDCTSEKAMSCIFSICDKLESYPLAWEFLDRCVEEFGVQVKPNFARSATRFIWHVENKTHLQKAKIVAKFFLDKSEEINSEQFHIGFTMLNEAMEGQLATWSSKIIKKSNELMYFILDECKLNIKDKAYDKLLINMIKHHTRGLDINDIDMKAGVQTCLKLTEPLVERGLDLERQFQNCDEEYKAVLEELKAEGNLPKKKEPGLGGILDGFTESIYKYMAKEKVDKNFAPVVFFVGILSSCHLMARDWSMPANIMDIVSGIMCMGASGIMCMKARNIAKQYYDDYKATRKLEEEREAHGLGAVGGMSA